MPSLDLRSAGVSLFEPHADIIIKGGREVHYGHKLNLTTGRSGLILDLVVEAGNPADRERLLPMLERHRVLYGQRPADPITRRRPLPHASTSSNRCLTPPTRATTRAKSSQSRPGMHNILRPSQKQAQHLGFMDGH